MTFSEWADQYMDSARILKEKIKALKSQLGSVPPHELPELDFRINTMHSMYAECVRVANILRKRKGEI